MGSQRLNDRNTRRLARDLDLPIVRAWAHGGTHDKSIVTENHRHGTVHRLQGNQLVVLWDGPHPVHFTSCAELFSNA